MRPAATRVELPGLTGLRIVLAAWIVVHHGVRWAHHTQRLPEWAVWVRTGQAATTGFFVLSGLTLAWVWGERLARDGTMEGFLQFLRQRWASVWPVGALGALLAIPYEVKRGVLEQGEFAVDLFLNLVLLQSFTPMGGGEHGTALRFDGPTWTLSTLLALYAAFPVIAWMVHRRIRSRAGLVALCVGPWLVVMVMAILMIDQPLAHWWFHVHPLMRLADFLAGVAVGTWLVRYGRPTARASSLLQAAAIAAVAASVWTAGHFQPDLSLRYSVWYLPAMVLFCTSLTGHGGFGVRALGNRPVARLGRGAFALLMVHSPIFGLAWTFGLFDHQPVWTAFGCAIISCVLAFVVHRWWEQPLRRRLRGPIAKDESQRRRAVVVPSTPR